MGRHRVQSKLPDPDGIRYWVLLRFRFSRIVGKCARHSRKDWIFVL